MYNYLHGVSDSLHINNTTPAPISIAVPELIMSMAITPDGTKAYVVSYANNGFVSIIDLITNRVVNTIPGFYWPRNIAITPNGAKAYVGTGTIGSSSVIHLATNTITSVNTSLGGMAFNPGATKLYTTNSLTWPRTMPVINTATDTVINTINVPGNPGFIAITPDGIKAYLIDTENRSIIVMNLITNTLITTIGIQNGIPQSIAMVGDRAYLTVSSSSRSAVSIINLNTNTIVSTMPIPVSGNFGPIAITPNMSQAYIAGDKLLVFDLSTNVMNVLIDTPNGRSLAISPDGTKVCTNSNNNVIVVPVLKVTSTPPPVVITTPLPTTLTSTIPPLPTSTLSPTIIPTTPFPTTPIPTTPLPTSTLPPTIIPTTPLPTIPTSTTPPLPTSTTRHPVPCIQPIVAPTPIQRLIPIPYPVPRQYPIHIPPSCRR